MATSRCTGRPCRGGVRTYAPLFDNPGSATAARGSSFYDSGVLYWNASTIKISEHCIKLKSLNQTSTTDRNEDILGCDWKRLRQRWHDITGGGLNGGE